MVTIYQAKEKKSREVRPSMYVIAVFLKAAQTILRQVG